MFKVFALFGLIVALMFMGYAAFQYSNVAAAITRQEDAGPQPDLPAAPNLTIIPAHRLLARCLSDVDDFLDSIHDPASFAAVESHILGRVRRHVADMRAYP